MGVTLDPTTITADAHPTFMCPLCRCLDIRALPLQCIRHGSQRLCEFWGTLSHQLPARFIYWLIFFNALYLVNVNFIKCLISSHASGRPTLALEHYAARESCVDFNSSRDGTNRRLICMRGIYLLIRTEELSLCQTVKLCWLILKSIPLKSPEIPNSQKWSRANT